MGKQQQVSLGSLMSQADLKLLASSGKELVRNIGLEAVRAVVFDVLTGRNLRDSTEPLTQHRIAALNLATANSFLRGASLSEDFVRELPALAATSLGRPRLSKVEKWLAQWALGLTDKGFQNILRDESESLAAYRDRYIEACQEVISTHTASHGQLSGTLQIGSDTKAQVDWLLMVYLLNTIGAQTLAVRGSEKSTYGKLFEKLILGSLLSILGFKHVVPPPGEVSRVFWLASQGEKRESDATLLYDKGKGVRFDIGFIGRGNPEISLDKVSRFERELVLGRVNYYMATIILVDRIGPRSKLAELAEDVEGDIVQMSASYWPQTVAQILNRSLGFEHELVNMRQSQIGPYLREKLDNLPIGEFIGVDDDKGNCVSQQEAKSLPGT